jgi:hypothetical protein
VWENLVTVTLVLEKCLDFIIYVLTVTRMGVDHSHHAEVTSTARVRRSGTCSCSFDRSSDILIAMCGKGMPMHSDSIPVTYRIKIEKCSVFLFFPRCFNRIFCA